MSLHNNWDWILR